MPLAEFVINEYAATCWFLADGAFEVAAAHTRRLVMVR
jgi:hypothetical protein